MEFTGEVCGRGPGERAFELTEDEFKATEAFLAKYLR